EDIAYEVVEHGQSLRANDLMIEGFGNEHAEIYGNHGRVQNTGYLVGEQLFIPGDAFTVPNKPVEVLALPVAGPWMKIKEAIDYALKVKPTLAFPVHDGILSFLAPFHGIPQTFLTQADINFVIPTIGKPLDLDAKT